ncbi:MFS transporter [Streptomyces luteocolor]|uniref:MFS transporter n=1 Tax=Streptomyces luteocolor TaxID=285500 RepID=UPI0008530ECD|nr:MFS transporter [Streptomyces luteocolor]
MTATGIRPAPTAVERPAHRDGNVLRWLTAYAASMIGDSVYFLALSWAATRTGSPAQAGLVLAVGAVPRALLMLGGGVVADRFGPRRVVIGSDAVRCLVILGTAALLLAATPGIWVLGAVALVFGAVDALFMPSVGALPARITAPGQLARVQGMRGVAARVATVTGGPLGGIAVATGGSAAAFGLAGVLFAGSLALLLAVRVRELPADDTVNGPTSARRDLADGLRYIRGHRVLAPLVVVIAVGELGFSGPANIGLVLLADERGWGASGQGWIVAGFGAGAGLASLLLAVRGRVPRAGAVLSWVAFPGTAALAALGFVPSVAGAVVAALVLGALLGLCGALCGALAQTVGEPAYLGRVTAVISFFTLGVAPLCYPVVGAAIGVWGIEPVFVACAALSAAGGVIGLCSKPLRQAELPR